MENTKIMIRGNSNLPRYTIIRYLESIDGTSNPFDYWGDSEKNLYYVDNDGKINKTSDNMPPSGYVEVKFEDIVNKKSEANLKVAIKGRDDAEYGKRIISYLESLGAVNSLNFDGGEGSFWAIAPGSINNSPWIGAYLHPPAGYKVITLDEEEENVCIENKENEPSPLLLLL